MEQAQRSHYTAQAQIMKALSHPTRLFIVEELGKSEKCVCELTDMIGADISTVSKHLSIMKNAGIVDAEKRGSSMFYTLKMKCVLNFFSCVNQVLREKCEAQSPFLHT